MLAQLVLAFAVSPPAEGLSRCRVRNATTGRLYVGGGANLQRAIYEARPWSALTIRGRCVGTFGINKPLILVGRRIEGAPLPTLDGNGGGTVLTSGNLSNVTIRNLRITGGTGSRPRFGSRGGGIANHEGRVVLRGASRVSGNAAEFGGGIWNTGTLLLRDRAVVARNRADTGGGIYQEGGVLRMRDSSALRRNRAGGNGGGIFFLTGDVVLRGHAAIRLNSALNLGGGIYFEGRTLTLRGSAQVTENRATAGGGIYDGIGNPIRVCSPSVAISPNDPDDPPATQPC
jgi:hypothetical protein